MQSTDVKGFENFMRGKGYKSLAVSSNPYEILRLFRKVGVSKDFIVVYKKANGQVTVPKKDEHWVLEYEKVAGISHGEAEKVVKHKEISRRDRSLMLDNYIYVISRAQTESEISSILEDITDLETLRALILYFAK